MHESWEAALSEYLDGDLPAGRSRDVERHLEGCAACRATLEDLRALRGDLARLTDREPAARLWWSIRAQIRERAHSWPATWAWPLAGTALALAMAAGVARQFRAPGAPEDVHVAAGPQAAAPAWDAAAAAWRERLARGRIDPVLSDLLESNLAPFDAAIAAVRLEVDKHPEDQILRQHLERLIRSELLYLRRAETAGRRAGAIRGNGT